MSNPYIIGVIVIVWFAVWWFVSSKNARLFNEKLAQQMLEKDEQYFEIRYLKNIPFLYLIISIFAVFVFFSVMNEFYFLKWSFSIIAVGAGIANYIYKAMYKIVFDHGRITLYIGKKVKITGTLEQMECVTKPYSDGNLIGPAYVPYTIVFESGGLIKSAKIIVFDEDMDNSYKLVAFFEKGNYLEEGGRFGKKKKNKKEKK